MLIGSGQEIYVEPALLFVTVYGIRDDRGVQMAQMRQAIRVVDRRCNVESLHSKKLKV